MERDISVQVFSVDHFVRGHFALKSGWRFHYTDLSLFSDIRLAWFFVRQLRPPKVLFDVIATRSVRHLQAMTVAQLCRVIPLVDGQLVKHVNMFGWVTPWDSSSVQK